MTTLRTIGDVALVRPSRAGEVLRTLPPADGVIANLEIPLTHEGRAEEKAAVHRASPELVDELTQLGVDAWTVATNHLLDFGVVGMRSTLEVLRGAGQAYVGAGEDVELARRPMRFTARDGSVVGLANAAATLPPGFAAGHMRPGVAPLRVRQSFEYDGVRLEEQPGTPPRVLTSVEDSDADALLDTVKSLTSDADIVVVALHWGVAWPFLPTAQGPLAAYQQPFAHRLIDAGADVVIGHHSHSLHPIEFYRGRPICYSLGNFAFHSVQDPQAVARVAATPSPSVLESGPWFRSAVLDLILQEDRWRVRVTPIKLDRGGDPSLAPLEDAESILRELECASKGFGTTRRGQDFLPHA